MQKVTVDRENEDYWNEWRKEKLGKYDFEKLMKEKLSKTKRRKRKLGRCCCCSDGRFLTKSLKRKEARGIRLVHHRSYY